MSLYKSSGEIYFYPKKYSNKAWAIVNCEIGIVEYYNFWLKKFYVIYSLLFIWGIALTALADLELVLSKLRLYFLDPDMLWAPIAPFFFFVISFCSELGNLYTTFLLKCSIYSISLVWTAFLCSDFGYSINYRLFFWLKAFSLGFSRPK